MSELFKSIITGLNEAIADTESTGIKLKRRTVTIVPIKHFTSGEIKKIRNMTGLSQRLFAGYIGVSDKTVEAWEAGTNHPSGVASRMLCMIETKPEIVSEFPFVR